jgi:ribosomal protein S18 acetylase RimI-like enzyme
MSITFRQPTPADTSAVGQLVFDAFASIHDRHHFPRDFPTLESAVGFAQMWMNHPKIWGMLAVRDGGKIVGCNFLNERNTVPGVGPICIDPAEQGGGIGRKLMQAVIERGENSGAKSIRLMQDAFNTASLSLYSSLGFELNEPIAEMRGKLANPPAATGARPMQESDLPACAELCRRVHGFDRTPELADALRMFKPFVVERGGKITAYLSAPTFWPLNHGVAEDAEAMKTLLAGASIANEEPLAFTVPTRNGEFFRWCLAQGLRMQKPMSLMTRGEYREPAGWWFPSVEY